MAANFTRIDVLWDLHTSGRTFMRIELRRWSLTFPFLTSWSVVTRIDVTRLQSSNGAGVGSRDVHIQNQRPYFLVFRYSKNLPTSPEATPRRSSKVTGCWTVNYLRVNEVKWRDSTSMYPDSKASQQEWDIYTTSSQSVDEITCRPTGMILQRRSKAKTREFSADESYNIEPLYRFLSRSTISDWVFRKGNIGRNEIESRSQLTATNRTTTTKVNLNFLDMHPSSIADK